MTVKGQTHSKRAREFALKERRERKAAKKEARASGIAPETDDADGAPENETPTEAEAETGWIQ